MFQLKMKHVRNRVGSHWNILNSEILKITVVGMMMNLFNNSAYVCDPQSLLSKNPPLLKESHENKAKTLRNID